MHTLTIVITATVGILAAAVFVYYLGLELRETFWSCPPAGDLPDAEGEALVAWRPPATVTTLHAVDLTGPDSAGISSGGCWATVARGAQLRDCGLETVDYRGVCRVHAEVLEAMHEAGA